MRFCIELLLDKDKINKDKNRIISYILKLLMEKESKKVYQDMFEKNKTKSKDLSFSMYMGQGVNFLRDKIEIPSRKVLVNFTTSDPVIGVGIYNSFIENEGLEIPIEDNLFTINRISLKKTRPIIRKNIRFTTKSPIVVREHDGDNTKTYYHDLSTRKGKDVFLRNLKYQIKDHFQDIGERDLRDLDIQVIKNKIVNVKHYNIVIPSNIGEYEICGKPYILKYLYLSGVGSRRTQGFGYIDIIE